MSKIVPMPDFEKPEETSEVIANFYRALGWTGKEILDAKKVRVHRDTWFELCQDCMDRNGSIGNSLFMNYGPGVNDDLKPGKVQLLKGWLKDDVK